MSYLFIDYNMCIPYTKPSLNDSIVYIYGLPELIMIWLCIYFFISAKRKLYALVDKVLSNRKQLRKDTDDALLIDVLLDSTDDKELIANDALSFVIGGFHTTGNSKILRQQNILYRVNDNLSTFHTISFCMFFFNILTCNSLRPFCNPFSTLLAFLHTTLRRGQK